MNFFSSLKIRTKLLLFILSIETVVILTFGYAVYTVAVRFYFDKFLNTKISTAKSISQFIDPEKHKNLKNSSYIYDSHYILLRKMMSSLLSDEYISYIFSINYDKESDLFMYAIDAVSYADDMIWFESDLISFHIHLKKGKKISKLVYDSVDYYNNLYLNQGDREFKIRYENRDNYSEVFINDKVIMTILDEENIRIETDGNVITGNHSQRIAQAELPYPANLKYRLILTLQGEGYMPGVPVIDRKEWLNEYYKFIKSDSESIILEQTNSYGNFIAALSAIKDNKGKKIGFVEVDVSLKNLGDFKKSIITSVLFLGLLSYTITAVLIYMLANHFINPIHSLSEDFGKFISGDRTYMTSYNRGDEFSQLANQFNLLVKTRTEELEKQSELKSRFLANMSHEIRTPMNAIIGYTQILLSNPNLPEKVKSDIQSIYSSGENLNRIVSDILDFTKLEAGKIQIERTDVDIIELLQNIIKSTSILINGKNVSLELEIGDHFPRYCLTDSVRLNQILLNLTGNAAKFTNAGKITLAAALEESSLMYYKVKFVVSDTGIGIPENKLHSIFESFTQASDDTTRLYGGTGLGLTIVKELVKLMNGTIEVESEIDRGSKFTVTMNLGKGKEPEKIFLNEKKFDFKGRKVLLAEDNLLNILIAVEVLEKANFKVEVANNGREAISKLGRNTYDLVLMDLHMPVMDGFEAIEIIRDSQSEVIQKDIPVIAITADAFDDTRNRVLEAGMNEFITKPIDHRELLQKIENCLL